MTSPSPKGDKYVTWVSKDKESKAYRSGAFIFAVSDDDSCDDRKTPGK